MLSVFRWGKSVIKLTDQPHIFLISRLLCLRKSLTYCTSHCLTYSLCFFGCPRLIYQRLKLCLNFLDYLLTILRKECTEIKLCIFILICTAVPISVIEIVISLRNIHIVLDHKSISVDYLRICFSVMLFIGFFACKPVGKRSEPTEKAHYYHENNYCYQNRQNNGKTFSAQNDGRTFFLQKLFGNACFPDSCGIDRIGDFLIFLYENFLLFSLYLFCPLLLAVFLLFLL